MTELRESVCAMTASCGLQMIDPCKYAVAQKKDLDYTIA